MVDKFKITLETGEKKRTYEGDEVIALIGNFAEKGLVVDVEPLPGIGSTAIIAAFELIKFVAALPDDNNVLVDAARYLMPSVDFVRQRLDAGQPIRGRAVDNRAAVDRLVGAIQASLEQHAKVINQCAMGQNENAAVVEALIATLKASGVLDITVFERNLDDARKGLEQRLSVPMEQAEKPGEGVVAAGTGYQTEG